MTAHPANDAVDVLYRLFRSAVDLSRDIKYDGDRPSHRYLLSNYGSTLQLTNAALVLISKGLWIAVHGIARSILELHIDLLNMLKDPKYIRHLEAANLKARIKLYEAALGGNPFLELLGKMPDLPQELAKKKKRLEELRSQKCGPLQWREKFERAGFTQEHESAYSFLSAQVHSDIVALLARHMDAKQSTTAITWFREEDPEEHVIVLDAIAGLVYASTLRIHGHFDSPHVAKIEALGSELAEVRKRLIDFPS